MEIKRTKLFIYFLAVAVLLYFCFAPLAVSAASATSKTVKTQKQLNAALKNSKVKTIVIKTSASKTFHISEKNYKTKQIVLRAKNTTLQSGGKLKSITVDSGKKLLHKGSAKTITTEAEGLDVTLDAGSRTAALIVNGDDSNIAMNGNSTVDIVSVEGEDATLHIAEGSDVDNVSITGDDARIQDEESTRIKAEEGIVAVVDESATSTNVDLSGDGIYSSVVNRTDEAIDLKIEKDKIDLPAGEVYSMVDPQDKTPGPLQDGNPFKKFDGMVKCGNVCLEIHGTGNYSYMSNDEKIHGWYHNISTGSDYECYFIINGSEVKTERIENTGFEKNYLGNAEFKITSLDDDGITLTSSNNIYGDNGAEYSFIYPTSGYQLAPGQDPVCVDNPLRIFSGGTDTCNGVWLEIHGTGVFANMSSGNRIHGWYHNTNTGTDYECRFIVNDSNVTVAHIENTGYEKNFMGETSFEIVSANSNSVVLQSTSNVYGDEGIQYTFTTGESVSGVPSDETEPGDVNLNNPLVIFSGRTNDDKGLNLEIHGNGDYSAYSHGDRIHGWYHNTNTGTDYECWFEVSGTSVTAYRTENTTYERNYLGDATFEITASDSTSVTLQSTCDIYGDNGTVYTFSIGN